MTATIVPKVKVEITLMRHNHFYFQTVRINGRPRIDAKSIDRDRAQEIYNNNQGGEVYATGRVDFTQERPCQWSWTAQFYEELDEEVSA